MCFRTLAEGGQMLKPIETNQRIVVIDLQHLPYRGQRAQSLHALQDRVSLDAEIQSHGSERREPFKAEKLCIAIDIESFVGECVWIAADTFQGRKPVEVDKLVVAA